MRRADLENASARLTAFEVVSHRPDGSEGGWEDIIPLKAPISGRMLRVLQKSEVALPAGKPILEIGDIVNDLEIGTELLSSDAVRVSVGDRAIVENWGGETVLDGVVERADSRGATKFSALGV